MNEGVPLWREIEVRVAMESDVHEIGARRASQLEESGNRRRVAVQLVAACRAQGRLRHFET